MGSHLPSAGSQCLGCLVWGLFLSLLCGCGIPPICVWSPWKCGTRLHLHPQAFTVASSEGRSVESLLCRSEVVFWVSCTDCECFLDASVRGGELRTRLLCRLRGVPSYSPSQVCLLQIFSPSLWLLFLILG